LLDLLDFAVIPITGKRLAADMSDVQIFLPKAGAADIASALGRDQARGTAAGFELPAPYPRRLPVIDSEARQREGKCGLRVQATLKRNI